MTAKVWQSHSPDVDIELKTVSKNTLIYSIGNIGVKLVSFLLIPLYTHYLTVFEVGIIVLLELLEIFYNTLAPMGLFNSLWRFFYNARKQGREKSYLVSNYLFITVISLALLFVLLASGGLVAKYFLSEESYTPLVRVFFIALFLGLSRQFILSIFRLYEQSIQFIIVVFVDFIFLISLTVWFVVGLDLGLWGVVYAKLIEAAAVFIYVLFYVLRRFGIHYHHNDVVMSLRYGAPLIFHGMGLLILMMSDRYFIKEIISVEVAGIYGIAYKFGMIMNMVLVTPFVQAWQPILFRLENDPNQKLTYQKIGLHYVQIATLIWLVISVLSKYLLMLTTTEEYFAGIIIIPWIAFSYLLYGLQNIFKAGALIGYETIKMTLYTAVAAVLNVLLNVTMIPKWGMAGAAIATVLSYLVMMLLVFWLSQTKLYINWRWKKMLPVILLGIVFNYCSTVDFANLRLNILKDLGLLLLMPLLMVVFKLASIKEVWRFVGKFRSEAPIS